MAPNLIPILPRRRPMPFEAGEPFRVTLPPGIPIGFGIDIGPAFLIVGESVLATWPVGPADVVAIGLDNLRRRLRSVRPRDLHRDAFEGLPVRILQSGVGCASALVLVPDELERIFGREEQCLIAPMRDLLISMPLDADRELVGWLNDEFATMDPNGLALDAFVFEGGTLRYETLRTGEARALSAKRPCRSARRDGHVHATGSPWLPPAPTADRVTVYVPAEAYVWLGLRAVDVDPSPKSQVQLSAPLVWFENETLQPVDAVAEVDARGGARRRGGRGHRRGLGRGRGRRGRRWAPASGRESGPGSASGSAGGRTIGRRIGRDVGRAAGSRPRAGRPSGRTASVAARGRRSG